MITAKMFLTMLGLDTPHDRIKLVKHVNHLDRNTRKIIEDGYFEIYQSEQSSTVKPFHNADVIISFIGLENKKAELYGVYKVNGIRDFTENDIAKLPSYLAKAHEDGQPRIYYDLEELTEFRPLRNRLIIHWASTRGWVQSKDLDVYELLPEITNLPFPGLQDIILNWDQLRHITRNPREHRDWYSALRSTAGIYRIVDMLTGEVYIGSAYGDNGLWARWSSYAITGHGGNKLLMGKDPSHFRLSIIRTLSGSISSRDIIKIENIEKEKHGSRVHGLKTL